MCAAGRLVPSAAAEHAFFVDKGLAQPENCRDCREERERVEEIARMQSGSQLTEVTRAAARALLETFHSPRRTTSSRSSSHSATKS